MGVISVAPHSEVSSRMSMTSKEWVVPPRPKPGRKPATDTPPTKRKAQNRAAQRAFRERRAARVGELEDQLDQQKETYDKQEASMKERIKDLEKEVQSFRSRCLLLESMLERERQQNQRTKVTERSACRPRLSSSSTLGQSSSRKSSTAASHASRPPSVHGTAAQPSPNPNPPLTCGDCSMDGPCACAEEVMNAVPRMGGTIGSDLDLKRPPSPSDHIINQKKPRHQERQTLTTEINLVETAEREDCGFCKDGTFCVCAEAGAPSLVTPPETLSTAMHQQTHTPPPSENDGTPNVMIMEMTAEGAVKLPKRKSHLSKVSAPKAATALSGCGPNGPGTCAQCQADPKSGLFCRLMAARFENNKQDGTGGGKCCGGKGVAGGGGCCKSQKPGTSPAPFSSTPSSSSSSSDTVLPSLPSLGLTCAEAYQTLSSHQNFARAADDIGSWLPKLRITPVDGGRKNGTLEPERKPVEVEAASIMSVLKDFDVRFGREA